MSKNLLRLAQNDRVWGKLRLQKMTPPGQANHKNNTRTFKVNLTWTRTCSTCIIEYGRKK